MNSTLKLGGKGATEHIVLLRGSTLLMVDFRVIFKRPSLNKALLRSENKKAEKSLRVFGRKCAS